MTLPIGLALFALAWLVMFTLVMCVVIAGARAEIAEQFREIQLPRQFTHHLSDNASERRGDGEGISFHEPINTTETGARS
ncbi:MAG TPA: hypothetical protein VF638_00830 [Sphingomonas sp.]|jgi:hypothetical protein